MVVATNNSAALWAETLERVPPSFPAPAQRPLLVYNVGVEGSGHHGVDPLFQTLASERSVRLPSLRDGFALCEHAELQRSRDMNRNLTHYHDHTLRHALFSQSHPGGINDLSLLRCWQGQCTGRLMPSSSSNTAGSVWIESASFPSGRQHRQPPAPLNLTVLWRALQGARFELRLLVLVRNFGATVWSHSEWDDGLEGHATLMAEHLVALGDSLESIPRSAWHIVPVDCV